MAIQRLSPLLVNQIAAGEVIERPASVVKELAENALDAGARRIALEVEDGGRELIRIADDGCGIGSEELPLALTAHATSKIAEASDLEAIHTMGFRGEALASIASISRLTLTSRSGEAEAGASIEASGESVGEAKPVGCGRGTVVEVRNLFFNTPARRKFMRGASTEMGHITETVQRLAMAHPEVGFALSHNGRASLDLPPDQSARDRCVELLGPEIAEGLLEYEAGERGIGLWGLAGMPALAKATARHQYVFVNGRPIRDRHVGHAIREAYRGLIEPTRQPLLVLFITLDPRMVDVNVHPTKSEVRFADSNAIHGQVLATIRQRLLGADLTPTARFGWRGGAGGSSDAGSGVGERGVTASAGGSGERQGLLGGGDSGAGAGAGAGAGGLEPRVGGDVASFVDYFRRMDPKQKGFVYQRVREELGIGEEGAGAGGAAAAETEGALGAGSGNGRDGASGEAVDRALADRLSVLQVHDSYIVTQDEQGLVIIDQHALHERVMFQSLVDRIESAGRLESQRMLTPVVVQTSSDPTEALVGLAPLLERIGVEAEAMGPRSLAVHAFPTLLFDRGVDPAVFIAELLDRAMEDDFAPTSEAALHETLDMMSCKAAVKAGENLTSPELAELLRKRDQIERSSNCPHGRPTTLRLPLAELEKQFKRR